MSNRQILLRIITPFSRTIPNLEGILTSINPSATTMVDWIIIAQHDLYEKALNWSDNTKKENLNIQVVKGETPSSYYGNSYRNQGIEIAINSSQSWVYFLDDDNAMHPHFWQFLDEADSHEKDLIFFSQVFPDGQIRLRPENIGVGGIDTAMILVRSNAIKDIRWKVDHYTADGMFAEDLAKINQYVRLENPLSFYNFLRPVTKMLRDLPHNKKSYLLPKKPLEFFRSLYVVNYFYEAMGLRAVFYIHPDTVMDKNQITRILIQQKYFFDIREWEGEPVGLNLDELDYTKDTEGLFHKSVLRGFPPAKLVNIDLSSEESSDKVIFCWIPTENRQEIHQVYTEALNFYQRGIFLGDYEVYQKYGFKDHVAYFGGDLYEICKTIRSSDLVIGNDLLIITMAIALGVKVIFQDDKIPGTEYMEMESEIYSFDTI